MSLFVALGTCYVFTFNFANVLFVCAPAPVACNVGVRSIGGVSWHTYLLCSLLFFVEHSVCRIYMCLPLVDFVLNFLHGVCFEFDQLLLQCIIRAGS